MRVGDLWRRSVLRRAAQRYADQGWPVVPGAFLAGERYVCGPLCPTVACHPAVDRWENAASTERAAVSGWWEHTPFSVLFATGRAFDVIEVPTRLGAPTARSDALGPVAVTPNGRWMFLVEPGETLRPELSARLDVVMHGPGSWVAAPPTRTPDGHVRWEIHPTATGWQLPGSYAVQKVLVAHLRPLGRVPTAASSRLCSWGRRQAA